MHDQISHTRGENRAASKVLATTIHGGHMPLQAIDHEMEHSFTQNVLKALLTTEEMEAEKDAVHPIASIAAVCGCADKP